MKAPVTERWARVGPKDARWFQHVPAGGLCLSVFLVVRNRKGEVLLGRPRRHRAWPEQGCLPYWRLAPLIENDAWVLPASHLLMEEHPDRAARRVARVWARLPRAHPQLVALDSSPMPTGRSTGRGRARRMIRHWAVGFVYEVQTNSPPGSAPWWSELRYFSSAELRRLRIGRSHRDLIRYALKPVAGRRRSG
jgi:ADP-ribose pyrophosphatase YjhB (NUDIX family)